MATTTTTLTTTSPQLSIELQPVEIHSLPESLEPSSELRSQSTPANAIDAESVKELPLLKLLSSGLSFLVAGINDGSLGALVPYILATYGVSTSLGKSRTRYKESKSCRSSD